MTRSNLKKGFFIILCTILAYIWWGNIQLFYGSSSYSSNDIAVDEAISTSKSVRTDRLEYKPPRINPFARTTSKQQKQRATTKSTQANKVPKLSTTLLTSGYVVGAESPQAIVQIAPDHTLIVTVGDSIKEWRVNMIDAEKVIFIHGKLKDTVFFIK